LGGNLLLGGEQLSIAVSSVGFDRVAVGRCEAGEAGFGARMGDFEATAGGHASHPLGGLGAVGPDLGDELLDKPGRARRVETPWL
jgi:hypothetical protein